MFQGIVARRRAGRRDARRARRRAARRGAELLLGPRHRELHERPDLHRAISSRARATRSRTSPSASPTTGRGCRCRSSRPCTASASAAGCRSPSAPTSGSPRPTRSSRSWRSAGASCRTWRSPRRCRGSSAPTSRASSSTRDAGSAARRPPSSGLVTRVADDPLAAARELAADIASRSPDAIRAGKRLIQEAWLADAREALLLETELQVALHRVAEPARGGHRRAHEAARRVHRPRLSRHFRGRGAARCRVVSPWVHGPFSPCTQRQDLGRRAGCLVF